MELSDKIIELIKDARSTVAKAVNSAMVITYFQIGKLIVEELQQGESRAEYGLSLLKNTSQKLTRQLGRGFSVDNLENMRTFFLCYQNQFQISEKHSRISASNSISESHSRKLPTEFLSWSHYVFLSKIEDKNERRFYEIEALTANWKLEELKRQFNSGLYERLALSRNKDELIKLAQKGQIIQQSKDIFKEPYILEFLGLEEQSNYSETELEKSIIDKIEQFMLEQGKGFFFGGRQVRFSFDEEHYFVDLVFYNRILRCFVLIDLKIGKLSHQDLGQMQMYVNYYDRFVKDDTEHPTFGIVLCKQKNENLVEITLPKDNDQIFAAKYKTILPDKSTLRKLIE